MNQNENKNLYGWVNSTKEKNAGRKMKSKGNKNKNKKEKKVDYQNNHNTIVEKFEQKKYLNEVDKGNYEQIKEASDSQFNKNLEEEHIKQLKESFEGYF